MSHRIRVLELLTPILFRSKSIKSARRLERLQIVQPNARPNLPRDLGKVLMMREVDHLPMAGHLSEQPEGLLGAKIVERFHDVVCDERNGSTIGDELVISRYPEREIQLKTRAFGEFVGDLRTAFCRYGDEELAVLAGLRGDPRVGSAASDPERLGCSLEKTCLGTPLRASGRKL